MKTARARVAKSAASENDTCTYTCRIVQKKRLSSVKNVVLCYNSNGQCLLSASIQFGMHVDGWESTRVARDALGCATSIFLRCIRALPTIRVHPELDGRTLDIATP